MVHDFAESLGLALDARDENTHDHSRQVAETALLLVKGLGLDRSRAELIHVAGHLHDIGKMGLPDSILKKQGALNDEEWRIMKTHPVIGARIVAPIKVFQGKNSIQAIILHHHERYDGKGYPCGIRGDKVPLGARVIAVAEALSAMIQNRPYRQGMTFEDAAIEIFNNTGKQLCPIVVNAFARNMEKIHDYYAPKNMT
ncbi:HD family phosphohydrolase [Desulfoplanes formicivorans]|uniref:HD family phosphohydrolase n=2 Tax=Desulfoplanes formicivorans TaxID=1592317 RepID=A0A194AK82_9BACT|nr:HD family phosphohydrolase [Desulfoplanes formicivorans]